MLRRHPICEIWPEYDITDMASDVAERGQDQDILLYEGMVLDGWHRYLSALKARKIPTFIEFEGTLVEAAEKVHAANNIRRHMTPEQRYACLLKLCEQVPEFGAKYEALKVEAASRITAGQPLATGSQRLNVVAAKAADAGVSPATAKKVERAVKNDREALDRLAKGKTTANKELGKSKKKTGSTSSKRRKSEKDQKENGRGGNGDGSKKEIEDEDTVGEGEPIGEDDIWEDGDADEGNESERVVHEFVETLRIFRKIVERKRHMAWSKKDALECIKLIDQIKDYIPEWKKMGVEVESTPLRAGPGGGLV
jgi:hypothetical protein